MATLKSNGNEVYKVVSPGTSGLNVNDTVNSTGVTVNSPFSDLKLNRQGDVEPIPYLTFTAVTGASNPGGPGIIGIKIGSTPSTDNDINYGIYGDWSMAGWYSIKDSSGNTVDASSFKSIEMQCPVYVWGLSSEPNPCFCVDGVEYSSSYSNPTVITTGGNHSLTVYTGDR